MRRETLAHERTGAPKKALNPVLQTGAEYCR
ncbi:hypothetical protein BH10PLA2_BH10PLA2_22790 [soil metagenome]